MRNGDLLLWQTSNLNSRAINGFLFFVSTILNKNRTTLVYRARARAKRNLIMLDGLHTVLLDRCSLVAPSSSSSSLPPPLSSPPPSLSSPSSLLFRSSPSHYLPFRLFRPLHIIYSFKYCCVVCKYPHGRAHKNVWPYFLF